ncbi:MAG: BON domain-containing protein [Actinomycetota bacterium]
MKIRRLFWAVAAGAVAEYFWDPELGRTRRAMTRDRVTRMRNRTQVKTERLKRATSAQMRGIAARAQHVRDDPPADDIALAHKVESKLFGDPAVPKGNINVAVEEGVLVLRGQLDNETQIHNVERAVRKIQGVHEIRSFLHIPGRPAPNKEASLRPSVRTGADNGGRSHG